jgi:hypothetical protein
MFFSSIFKGLYGEEPFGAKMREKNCYIVSVVIHMGQGVNFILF